LPAVRLRSLTFHASFGETSTKLEQRSRGGGGKPKAKVGLSGITLDVMIERLRNQAGFVGAALVVTLAGVISWRLRIGFVWALLIAIFAVLVNGVVATLEDDLPGGFNNPDGTSTPEYLDRVSRIGRRLGGLLASAVAVGVFTAAWRGTVPLVPGLLFGLASVLLGLALVVRWRVVQWTALLLVVIALGYAISHRA
jgi:hypothetical protein